MKRALITGASGALGEAFALELAKMGWSLVITGQNEQKLARLAGKLPRDTTVIAVDLSKEENCRKLYDRLQALPLQLVINNAGIGVYGAFSDTSLEREMQMLGVNVAAVHILTKLFLQKFQAQGKGYILNVASSAAFYPGALMAAYYAGKSYVLRLTEGIREELRQEGSAVVAAVCCPGPIESGFHERAGIRRALPAKSAAFVARKSLQGLFRGEGVILPDSTTKCCYFLQRFLPERLLAAAVYRLQKRKEGN